MGRCRPYNGEGNEVPRIITREDHSSHDSLTLPRRALLLGLIVLLALGSGAFFLFQVGSAGWYGADALEVAVGFDDIGGVEAGTAVRVQGIVAGEVAAIEPPEQPSDPVILRLKLKSKYRHLVRTDARVRIIGEGLVGGKVVEILPQRSSPGLEPAPLAINGTRLTPQATIEVAQLLEKIDATLGGQGTLGKFLNDPQAYNGAVSTMEEARNTLASLRENSDGLQKTWMLRSVVEKPIALLERFNSHKERWIFRTDDLFSTNHAVLTEAGKHQLDQLVPRLNSSKKPGSDVVVVAYADPQNGLTGPLAKEMTTKQSEAVVAYLKTKSVHSMGWWSSRPVTALGQGHNAPPLKDATPQTADRVEVLIFTPQK